MIPHLLIKLRFMGMKIVQSPWVHNDLMKKILLFNVMKRCDKNQNAYRAGPCLHDRTLKYEISTSWTTNKRSNVPLTLIRNTTLAYNENEHVIDEHRRHGPYKITRASRRPRKNAYFARRNLLQHIDRKNNITVCSSVNCRWFSPSRSHRSHT